MMPTPRSDADCPDIETGLVQISIRLGCAFTTAPMTHRDSAPVLLVCSPRNVSHLAEQNMHHAWSFGVNVYKEGTSLTACKSS